MRLRTYILAIFLMYSGTVWAAKTPDEAEFKAAASLGEDVAAWIEGLGKPFASIGIFTIQINEPLSEDYGSVIESELLKGLSKIGLTQIVTCPECRNPVVSVEGEEVIVSRGVPDAETLKKIAAKRQVEAYLTLDVYRTALSVVVEAVLYQNPTGSIISAESFTIPALNFADSSVQVLFTLGGGKVVSGKGSEATKFSMAGNISLLEEIGFAKGGVTLGGIIATDAGTLLYLNPTLAFRGRMGRSGLGWGLSLGVGYGMNSSTKGITLRGAYDVYLGSFAVAGLEYTHFIKDSATAEVPTGYAGFHIGIALGR